MIVYDGKLYVGTYDASSFLIPLDEYMNDKNAKQEWKDEVDKYIEQICSNYKGVPDSAYTCAEYLDKATFGFDLYVTEDGVNFTKITDNGFGDPYNHGCREFSITNEGLFVGTANPFYGTQVWKLSEKSTLPNESDDPKPEESNESNNTEPSNENNSDSPKTGDSENYMFYILAGLSLTTLLLCITYKKRIKTK